MLLRLTKQRSDCIICIMLAVLKTSMLVFYAVAAGLALLPVVVFFVALIRKKHVRRGYDVLFIVFAVLAMLCALAVGAFAVVLQYAPFKTATGSIGDKLYFFYNGKELFAVPKIGYAATLFADLKKIGVIVPFAVAGLYFMATVTVGAKTFRKKNKRKKDAAPAHEQAPAQDMLAQEGSERAETVSEQETASPLFSQPTQLGEQTQESETFATGEPTQDELLPSETAKSIVDEIDALVDGAAPAPGASDIDSQLQRAIREGYALFDGTSGQDEDTHAQESMPYTDSASVAQEDYPAREEYHEEEIPAEEEQAEEDTFAEEDTPSEEETYVAEEEPVEEEPYIEDGTPVAREHAAEEKEENTAGAYVPPVRRQEVRIPEYIANDLPKPTHVRTIVRRPPARNGEELSRYAARVEERREGKESAKSAPAAAPAPAANVQKSKGGTKVATKKTSAGKPAAAENRTQGTPSSSRKTAKTAAATPQKAAPQKATSKSAQTEQTPHKDVTAQTDSLPLTRKYIILNRRSAAAIFNEYLNSKRDKEKEELTESLNTIIIK